MLLPYNRAIRIAVLIRQTVSYTIKNIMELENVFITIMDVVLTKDLLNCKIYYSVFGDNKTKQQVSKVLNYNLKHIRHKIALTINLRHTPSIYFIFDDTNEKANRIHDIFRKLTKEHKLNNTNVYK
jgi:ribosome-binding factor A